MNKINTVPEARRGKRWSLSTWLSCYPFMAQQPNLWFRGMSFSESELAQYPDIAQALGHISKPIIINFNQSALAKVS